jgi:hypothetical protein
MGFGGIDSQFKSHRKIKDLTTSLPGALDRNMDFHHYHLHFGNMKWLNLVHYVFSDIAEVAFRQYLELKEK